MEFEGKMSFCLSSMLRDYCYSFFDHVVRKAEFKPNLTYLILKEFELASKESS